jgi:hypothetical protein
MRKLLNPSLFAALLAASPAASLYGGDSLPAVSSEGCRAAVLRNGFTIEYVRREVTGPATRLWLCADAGAGFVEVPSGQIEGFEEGRSTPPPSPVAPVPAAPPTAAPPTASESPVKDLISSAALRHQIDPDFVASVVRAESGFLPTAVSPKGALGLMQLMPQTAAGLGVKNVLDPAANVEGGTRYLRQLLDRYAGDAVKALAAYNAGPERVDQYGGIPPYRETRVYIARIIEDFNRKKLAEQARSTTPSGDK